MAETVSAPKDPKIAAVMEMLQKKKVAQMLDSDHKPTIVGAAGGVGGSSTADKVSGIDKIKRSMISGGSAAPIKLKPTMTVKLKPNQISFKTTETKTVKKE